MPHYHRPGRLETRLVHSTVARLARHGISLHGSAELSVRGRSTGEWRRVPVGPLPLDGERYLVSVRGESQWVRNMRAAGGGQLRIGRTTRAFTAVELSDDDEAGRAEKAEVLRHYLAHWGGQLKKFFDGADGTSPREELLRIAPDHPVFRITDRL
ncbi:nitroreductase family deazaflavin-dependent oxidoreductase [Streptomyces sp. F63]|uniref:nitroreductase/quinone reductase family protein n=1 Tax=Streptomyces sp. F63 TaxID=2824887 RepID=UPI001B36D487|nr:nitroreductase/quinone reductase family protein [Streptomyces sp. F63]MBQ0985735.1 nitroreductase family deazaflavin-dependent oxidoreductase [Streptomyces sp. F63]